MSGYAFLNEIWSEEKPVTKQTPPQCKMDNIMDAYLQSDEKLCTDQEQKKELTKKCWDNKIEGYDDSKLLKNAYNVSDYFDDELEIFNPTLPCQEEVASEAEAVVVPKQAIYRDLVEKYANTTMEQSNMQYMELGIYVFSGIIIIFLMEQILQIGKSLR